MYEPRLIHLQWLIETIQAKDTINCTVGDKILSKQALSYLQIKKANMYPVRPLNLSSKISVLMFQWSKNNLS